MTSPARTPDAAELPPDDVDAPPADLDAPPAEEPAPEPEELPAPGVHRADLAICVGIAAVAAWIGASLWPDPASRVLALNPADQALDEWFLARATRLWAGDFGLVTHLLNAPDGVNLLANASLLGLGAMLAPVTLVFGAPVAFAVAVAANLAGTGIGWYLLLRTVPLGRLAAAVGAAFTAFAPGIVAQSNGHLHLTAQWLVPAMVWCVLRLATGPPPWARAAVGALLAVLVVVQVFVGEEILFLTAVTMAVFCLGYGAVARGRLRPVLGALAGGLGVAVGLAGLALAVPLWVQFAGAQHVPDSPFNRVVFSADLYGFAAISPLSLAGSRVDAHLAASPAEYTSFFGLPLLLVVLGAVLWLWRRPAVLAAAVTSVVLALLALGPRLVVDGRHTTRPMPYGLVADLRVVNSALPGRFALAIVPLFAIILATALDVALRDTGWRRLVVPAAVLAALLPIAPRPLPTAHRTPVPRYFTDGDWRGCTGPGGVLVPVPLPDGTDPDTMRWAAAADARFALPQGEFIGPYGQDGHASLGVYPRPTAQLLARVGATGVAPAITEDDRQAAQADVAYWHASCVVLAHPPNEAALRTTLDALFGPGQDISDVRVWPVG